MCDWQAVGAIGELLQGIAAIGAVLVAGIGLRTWLVQRRHKYAERAVVLARRFEAQASACRRQPRSDTQPDKIQELWDDIAVLGETARKIRELQWLTSVQGQMDCLGRGLGDLWKLFGELRTALRKYDWLCHLEGETSTPLQLPQRNMRSEIQGFLYGADGGEYSRRVADAVERIEAAARAFIG